MSAKKILVVFSHNRLTGVTTFNSTLAKILSSENYEVHVHVVFRETKMSLVEDKLKALYPVTFGSEWPPLKFNAIFFSDNKSLHLGRLAQGNRVFLAHGLGEASQEVRPEDVPLISHLFALSPFMNSYYANKYPLLSQSYLPNLIDTDVFNIEQKLHSFPKMALLNDRRKGKDYVQILSPVFSRLNIELIPVYDLNFGYPIWDMQKIYRSFDLVLGYGRSIYEAMSCGRNVISVGLNGVDGFLDEKNFTSALYKNASGWGIQKFKLDDVEFSQKFEIEVQRYSEKYSQPMRQLILENMSVLKNKGRLLESIEMLK